MRKLTKTEAIKLHRKLWNWIADETEKRKIVVIKEDYFFKGSIPLNRCYCCEYDEQHVDFDCKVCPRCPIDWGNGKLCDHRDSAYQKWLMCNDDEWQKATKYAREIANLPERKFEEEE